jgi:hypothetical protein
LIKTKINYKTFTANPKYMEVLLAANDIKPKQHCTAVNGKEVLTNFEKCGIIYTIENGKTQTANQN